MATKGGKAKTLNPEMLAKIRHELTTRGYQIDYHDIRMDVDLVELLLDVAEKHPGQEEQLNRINSEIEETRVALAQAQARSKRNEEQLEMMVTTLSKSEGGKALVAKLSVKLGQTLQIRDELVGIIETLFVRQIATDRIPYEDYERKVRLGPGIWQDAFNALRHARGEESLPEGTELTLGMFFDDKMNQTSQALSDISGDLGPS